MADLRGYTLRLNPTVDLVTETCYSCSVLFAMTEEHRRRLLNNHDKSFYCPNGHKQHYTGKTTEQKLIDAQARETALRDQLDASIRDAEAARSALARDRQRFTNGVCPCCNRSFENVRRHMTTKHPDFDVTELAVRRLKFNCGCGARFETYHGLRVHQGKSRRANWSEPGQDSWRSHLTEGVSR